VLVGMGDTVETAFYNRRARLGMTAASR
jgi:hypothetical protein